MMRHIIVQYVVFYCLFYLTLLNHCSSHLKVQTKVIIYPSDTTYLII